MKLASPFTHLPLLLVSGQHCEKVGRFMLVPPDSCMRHVTVRALCMNTHYGAWTAINQLYLCDRGTKLS